MSVQALYVDPTGPYPRLLGAENCWGIDRNANYYAGPYPVVAHPPCGPWGKFRKAYKGGEGSADCAVYAIHFIRSFGGVLEHPVGSALWSHLNLPMPGAPADAWGGYSVQVRQVNWGHSCPKPTLLYICGAPRAEVVGYIKQQPARTHTHLIANNARARRIGAKIATRDMRFHTPLEFACFLIELARFSEKKSS